MELEGACRNAVVQPQASQACQTCREALKRQARAMLARAECGQRLLSEEGVWRGRRRGRGRVPGTE
jgi:hypothetical protein